MSKELDKGGALSELITQLTRDGEPFAVTKIVHHLKDPRRLLHQWELAAIDETLAMEEHERKALLEEMRKPEDCYVLILRYNREGLHVGCVMATFPNLHSASAALLKWMQSKKYVMRFYIADDDPRVEFAVTLKPEFKIPNIEYCQLIVQERLPFGHDNDYNDFVFDTRSSDLSTFELSDSTAPPKEVHDTFYLTHEYNPIFHTVIMATGMVVRKNNGLPVYVKGKPLQLERRSSPVDFEWQVY